MDKKTFSIGFIVFFVVLTIYLYNNNDRIAAIISNGSAGFLWYFLSNPAYVLLLLSISYFNQDVTLWRNFLGSFMIIIAADIVSYPRFLTSGIGAEIALLASSDGIIIKTLISYGFIYETAFMIYYLVLPIILIISALALLGIHNFFNIITKRG